MIAKYRVTSIKQEADSVKVFRLEPLEGRVMNYKPGQFVFLHFLDEKGESTIKRAYSIASSPDLPYLELAIKMIGGEFTSKLDLVREGEILGVDGPHGHMAYNDESKTAMVCGGCGVAPMMGILRQIAKKQTKGDFILFYSVRNRDQIQYREELEEIRRKNPAVRLVITLTREEPAGWPGEYGRISWEMLKKHSPDPREFNWFMCGPVKMLGELRTSLVQGGVDKKKIKMEGWG